MKIVKGIGLFFIYPLFMLTLGFYAGVEAERYFNPSGQEGDAQVQEEQGKVRDEAPGLHTEPLDVPTDYGIAEGLTGDGEVLEAAAGRETLCVDTEYVLKETNILDHTEMETRRRLPDRYVGLNREQFLDVMNLYEEFPPLAEQERGFVGLEVLSFSRERVVVRMDYRYIQPTADFYLAAYDNKVLVYLEDRETVFIETDIRLETLPPELQQSIIRMMRVEGQEELYNFLETYSS